MATLEDLRPGVRVEGIVAGAQVAVVAVSWHGADGAEVTFKRDDGSIEQRLLFRADEARISVIAPERAWSFDADGDAFKLASEARRIQLAHLFDPYTAVESSAIDPLPHQIEAVYERMLPLQPLRFLLADDPGAGKTIMAGLYVRELIARGDVDRCLVLAPGSLIEQWQDEMWQRFHLPFDIMSRDLVDSARTGNPFVERNLLIARVHQLSRSPDLIAKLQASEWDLIIVDEAHKMSAHAYGGEVTKTKLFQLGELLPEVTRHLLLMTATPHNGKDEDYRMFLSLLDPDRFLGHRNSGKVDLDASDLMRRYVKESLVTFEGKPLFPKRFATTVRYELSPLETALYEAVTDYVKTGMDSAKRLEEGGDRKRGLVAGFALAALQRRLASSPNAIYRSLQRRRERLEQRILDLENAGRRGPVDDPLARVSVADLDEFDTDDYADDELEGLEDDAISEATLAATVAEMQTEIKHLAHLEDLAAAVRESGTDKKWEQLSSILQGEELTGTPDNPRKLIVFTEHKDTLDYLVTKVRKLLGRSEEVVAIHGGMHREDRKRAQDEFVKTPTARILIATDAAGEGVNLQRANLMVNYDLPWNPNRMEQRFGRIHRIGQREPCYLWNLLAHNTREGAVFDRLLEKIERMKEQLGEQVYDVLGDTEMNVALRELLIKAIREGQSAEVRDWMEEIIDRGFGERVKSLIDERAAAADLFSTAQVGEIRDAMERAKARRLQPGFIKAFVKEALDTTGGRIVDREPNRFEVTRVPAAVRSRQREVAVGAALHDRYERVTFDKSAVHMTGRPPADLLAPGHPLLSALVDTVLERHGSLLRKGAVLVDPDDPGETPHALVYLEHSVHDGRSRARPVSTRFQFVEIDPDGVTRDPGPEPYLLYRKATEGDVAALAGVMAEEWLNRSLNETARTHAIANLAGPHYAEVKQLVDARVKKVRAAVEERLTSEIRYWDRRAAELKEKELRGKTGPGGMTPGHARARAEDMEARRQRRLRELDQEADLSNVPPVVVGGALVVPQGLLDRLTGLRFEPVEHYVKDVTAVERRAVDAVVAAEKALGRIPEEMQHNHPGYDIESKDPQTGQIYFIEVKGRIEGEDTVNVKVRQVRMANNNLESFRLALVTVPRDEGAAPSVRYVVRPFAGWEPHFAQVSVPLDLKKMLAMSQEPT